MFDQAHDRVRRGRDEVGRQIWQRIHAGEANHEQAAAGCQQPGDPGQGVIKVEMVQHGHHRDQVSLTVTGRRGEVLEAAPANGHPRSWARRALQTSDLDPAHRMLRIRAETTKYRLERVVPYSAATGVLMTEYLAHRSGVSRARGPLFLSESRRNHAQPLSLWTWSKVIRRIALEAGVSQFSTHTLRHPCLTDLARMGWEVHAIAAFAGHRHTDSTLAYIHLSGRDLADKLSRGMEHIHGWRIEMLTGRKAAAAGASW